MLSDEEKKAIKELTEIKELFEEDLKADYEVTAILDQIDLESLVIALNLIEKQSKEIEELKEDKEIIKRNYEDLVDENEKFLYDSAVYLMGKDDTNSKWKDKIKAKIEEVSNGTYDAKIVMQSLLEKE